TMNIATSEHSPTFVFHLSARLLPGGRWPLHPASAGLFHPHVPFDEPADLALGIPALHHPRDEIAVLLLGLAVLLRPERDDRQQILDLREYPLFDYLADLFVTGP